MSKKRTKSPANNAANNNKWESNIVTEELNEGQWSYSMLMLVENIIEDKETIDYIRKGIQTGLRRKFSLLSSDRLTEMVLEYGGGKGKKGKDAPQNFEVCEHAKTYLDRGEKIPATVTAKLIKWAMLTAKIDDAKDKSDGGKKFDGKGSKSKKAAEKPDRSKSSAGKKGAQAAGKKSPEPPSVKGDTKLRKRGDPDPDIQFIDDEPDDGSSRYFVVTGLADPSLIEALAEIGCIVTSVVKVTRDIHISNDDNDENGKETDKVHDEIPKKEESTTELEEQSEKLTTFWSNITGILNNNKNLFNTPIVTLVAKHLMFPIDKDDVEQQQKCSMELFETVAVLTYDLLDLKRQWRNYLEKSKIVELPIKCANENKPEVAAAGESARDEKVPSEEAPTKIDTVSVETFDRVDMDYYRYLLQDVPIADTSVFLQMSAMLDQIDVTNGDKAADWNQAKLSDQEGLSDEAAAMLHELVNKLFLSKEDVQELRQSLKLNVSNGDELRKGLEAPIHALDGISLRNVQINSNGLGKEGSMIRELRMVIKSFQQMDLLQSVPVDDIVARKRAARLQEFLKYIDNTGLSKIEINYAIKLFILESLVVSGTDENGIIRVNDQEGVFPKNLNQPWDDPFIILEDVNMSIIEDEHEYRNTKVEMFEENSDTARDDSVISGRSSTEGILKTSRSLSRSPVGNQSSRRKSSVHFAEVDTNELTGCVTEAELDIAGMLSDEADDSLQSILLDYLQNIRKRSFTEWCFEEFYEPHVMLQIIQEAFYRLPFLDIYSERKSDGKIVVLHNPFQKKLKYNQQTWSQWLHANVGFRNYLDFINDKITDWTRDQEAIYQAMLLNKELENSEKPKEEESPKPNLKKSVDKGKKSKQSKSRSRSVSQSSSVDESDNKEIQFVLPGSLKALKMEQDKILKAKEEEERKKEEKRSLSAQKKAEKEAPKDKVKRPSSKASNKSKSKKSVIGDIPDPAQLIVPEQIDVEPEEYWPFIGYDLGDNLAHFSGEVAHLFPSDGCTMRIQRTQKLLDSTSVRVSIITPQSHVFSLHIIDPLINNDDQVDNFEQVLEQLENQSTISRYGASTCVFNDGVCLAASNHGYSGSSDRANGRQLEKGQSPDVVNNQSGRSEENAGEARENSLNNTSIPDINRESTDQKNSIRDNVDLRDSQNIILTSPNGVQVRIGYELGGIDEERKLLLYLTTNEDQYSNSPIKEKLQPMKEIGRYVMSDGKVVSIFNNDSIKVMFPDGTVASTTLNEEIVVTRQEETDESKIEKANTRETPSQKKKKQSKVPPTDQAVVVDLLPTIEDRKEIIDKIRTWTVTRTTGEIFETKANLNVFDVEETSPKPTTNIADDVEEREEEINFTELPQWKKYLTNSSQKDSLLISCATDPATGETLITRSDGTLLLTTQDAGIFLSEHLDRTRFTKYYHLEKIGQNKETEEPNIIEIIQIESENYPMITIDRTYGKIETRCGSMCSIVSEPDGSHYYKHSDGTEIEYRPDGEMIFTAASNSQMSYLQPYGSSSYVLNAMSNVICELLDSDGSEFIVNASGNYEVKRNVKETTKPMSTPDIGDPEAPKPTSAISGASDTDGNYDDNAIRKYDQHAPRIFFLNADGSGSELLRYRDIVDTIVSAEVDGNYFQYKESIQDHPHIFGHTIMHPIPKTKPWQYDYSRKTVLPKGLTCRDMKTFPATEAVKPGPQFAMTIGKGLSIATNPMKAEIGKKTPDNNTKSLKSTDSLQFRQFYHYPLISDDIRQSFDSELVEYNKAVLRQRRNYKDLEMSDDRTIAEHNNADEIKGRYINMMTVNGQIMTNAIHALSEDIQSSTVLNDGNIKTEKKSNDHGSKSNRKHLDILLEKEKIEKEMEIENKRALKNQFVPNYFTSIYGKDFLTNQAVDLSTLNKSMKLFPLSRESTAKNETEPAKHCSDSSPNIDIDKIIDPLKDRDTTIKTQSPNNQTDKDGVIIKKKGRQFLYYDSSLIIPSLPKRTPITSDLPLPRYLYSQRPSVEQNVKQATVEDPVRRKQLMTSLIGGPALGQIFQRQCRGLNVLPSRIDTGLLREGDRYTFKIKIINTGPESSFFKVKQPPSTSGIWVEFVPGPIPAGLSRTIIVHIYAIAKTLESSDSSVYMIEHPLKIITDTDILEIPITGRVMTAEKYDVICPLNKVAAIVLPTITESLPAIKSEN